MTLWDFINQRFWALVVCGFVSMPFWFLVIAMMLEHLGDRLRVKAAIHGIRVKEPTP